MAYLAKKTVQRTNKAKKRLIANGFDELNAIDTIDSLYADLDTDNRVKFKELFIARYIEVMRDMKRKIPHDDLIDDLAEMYLAGLLSEPNETTHYTYDTEVYRKRDRAKEAINSVNGRVLKQIELDKNIRQWSAMTGWYLDFTSQGAEIQALRDSGVKKVRRHEMDDGRTCSECRKADGEVYDIDKIPELPHLRCRRWFTPA